MNKTIDIKGIGSPGVSLTENLNRKFKGYEEFCKNHCNEEMNYKEMQIKMSQELKITESAIRVDIPFLYNNGFLNEYRKDKIGKIKLNNFISDLGKSYLEIIKMQDKYSEKLDDRINNEISRILKFVMILALIHRKKNGQEENYFKILRFIYYNNSIDENEFYLMLTTNEDELKYNIEKYRKGELNITLENNNTVFEYNKRLLIQAGLIEDVNRRYYLNKENIEIIKDLI